MFSDALGQEGQEIVNFKCISNTDDFVDNSASRFYNRPYEGVEFDRRYSYNVRAISSTIPFTVDSHIEKDLWYKRLQIPYDEPYETHYKNTFAPDKYQAAISSYQRIAMPIHEVNKSIIGPNAKDHLPDQLINFFNCSYINKVFHEPYLSLWEVRPLLKIERSPEINQEADDIFEFTVKRSELNNSRNLSGGGDWNGNPNESGYIEIIRMSRTLKVLLGLNVLDHWNLDEGNSQECFPVFTKKLEKINLNCFSKEIFYNPPLEELKKISGISNLKPCGFWGTLMKTFEIPFILIKIYQSYSSHDEYQGGNLTKSIYNEETETGMFMRERENHRKEQYADYFVCTILDSGIDLKTQYYNNPNAWDDKGTKVVSPNPNMSQLTRGISWSVSNYLRQQIGCMFNMSCNFIDQNIYNGTRGKTIINDEIPLNMKKQHPFTKFTISPRLPLSNRFNVQDTTTIGFFTKRILRFHLDGIFKKLKTKKSKKLQKRQLILKSLRYPIQVTMQVIASN